MVEMVEKFKIQSKAVPTLGNIIDLRQPWQKGGVQIFCFQLRFERLNDTPCFLQVTLRIALKKK